MSNSQEYPTIKPACLPWYKTFLAQLSGLKRQQRLPHAMLLSIPGEQNHTDLLWYIAMSLLCEGTHHEPHCGECSSCRLMLANTYPDFKLVSLEYNDKSKLLNKNIKIEQIRDLIHEVYLTRSYDNLKIVVIYPADKMSIAGANSLLKTLEEPAERVIIILATHHSGKIPVTIRSRCQQWNLDNPETPEALAWLQQQGMDDEVAEQYLDFAGGDPLGAVNLRETGFIDLFGDFKQHFSKYLKNQIDVTKLCQLLSANDVSLTRRIISKVIKAYCFQFCGLQGQQSTVKKKAAQAMIDLLKRSEQRLMIEENNLDLQLQLEDVLISVKQIITSSH
ncbi:MAG: hypothetical protein GY820_15465 [Gammaproteobacteria bacterium]|nr:hypothetical protein [Gammaproteobacteria bacterium]